MWCMKRINRYLAEGQAAALDRVAAAADVSRAELIRELINRAIDGHSGKDMLMPNGQRLLRAVTCSGTVGSATDRGATHHTKPITCHRNLGSPT